MNSPKIYKYINLIWKYSFLFIVGGISYCIIEILYRGYTDISMGILGGICFISCGLENELFTWETPLILQMLIACIVITILEFITGYIVNIQLGMEVWNYSHMPFNIMGQVCLPFTIIWFFLSAIAIVVDDYLRYFLFGEEKPRYKLI